MAVMEYQNDQTINSSVEATTIDNEHASNRGRKCTSEWYSKVKDNPQAHEKLKEYQKLRYKMFKEIKALATEAEHKGPNEAKTIVKPSPEMKKRYNQKYYAKHKESIIQQQKEYIGKEMSKELSDVLAKKKAYMKQWRDNVRSSPELVEKRREYMRGYYAKRRNTNQNTGALDIDAQNDTQQSKERQYKLSWYTAIRENPTILAQFKEYAKQRRDARKLKQELLKVETSQHDKINTDSDTSASSNEMKYI